MAFLIIRSGYWTTSQGAWEKTNNKKRDKQPI